MQKFNKTKISMAVGASLLAMVGAAQAAPAAPTLRGVVPLVISAGPTAITARGLYDGTGYNGTLTVTLNFVDSVNSASSATPGDPATLTPGTDGFLVNGNGVGLLSARAAADDANIYTVGTVNTDLLVTAVSFAPVTPATPGSQQVQATIDVASGTAPAAFRISAAGNLEWIADITALAANWLPVKLAFNTNAAATDIQAVDSDVWLAEAGDGGLQSTALGAIAGQDIKNGIAPLPKIGTKATTIVTSVPGGATAGDLLVDGVTIDTLTPTLAFSTANVMVTTAAGACSAVDAGSRAIVSTTSSTSTTVATVQITTPSTTADWTSGNTAADNAAYKPACFNTGINDGTVPFTVGLNGTAPTYTNVYDVNTGTAVVPVSLGAAVILDFSAPVVVASGGITFSAPTTATTGSPSLTNVSVIFSEPMTLIGMNDLREVLENVFVGTDTLAALSLNSGSSPSLGGITTTAGRSTLTINNVATLDVATLAAGVWTGKSMSVGSGITNQEVNDTNYTANLAAGTTLDIVPGIGAYGEQLAGGVVSTSGAVVFGGVVVSGIAEAVPAIPVAQTAGAPSIGVAWGTDTSARASASSANNPDQIDTITVTFAAGKGVKYALAGTTFGTAPALAAAKTAADLTANLVVDVHGTIGADVLLTGVSSNSTTTLTVASTAGLVPGEVLAANATLGIAAGTTIASITNGTTLVMSAAATLTAGPVALTATQGTVFQVKPLTATLDTANQITVTLPTKLIYDKLSALNAHLAAVYIGYVADGDNAVNNTLVSTDAASTLTSPIRVLAGVLQPAGAGTAAELTGAGAEPVVLPFVFTRVATGSQSTLLTQSIQTTVAGATGGSVVDAYLARWVDTPTTTINVSSSDIKTGKITNPGDQVATDLAIYFGDQSALAGLIQTELQRVAKSTAAVPGVSAAAAAVKANPIPVYVKLIRSNDKVANGNNSSSQIYLNARAILGTTYAAADTGGSHDGLDPIYQVMLDATTGKITGHLTGSITIKPSSYANARGLQFLDGYGNDISNANNALIGSSIVAKPAATDLPATPGATFLNLLVGIDPNNWNSDSNPNFNSDINHYQNQSANFGALAAKNPFLLLVYREAGSVSTSGTYTLLTSADPAAANYMPFKPDLFNTTTGTGGVAVRAKTPLSVTDVKALDLPASNNWALYGLGNPALAAKSAVTVTATSDVFPRRFVGLINTGGDSGVPKSFWTNNGYGEVAMSIAGNKVGVATQLLSDTCNLNSSFNPCTPGDSYTGPTLSTISDANTVKGAVGLAWDNDNGGSDGSNLGKLYVAQATGTFVGAGIQPSVTPKLAAGWSLVTVPAGGTLGTVVDAVIKVGAQVGIIPSDTPLTQAGSGAGDGTGQFTWFASDGTPMPTLTAGEAVFVHAKAAGNL